MEGELLYWMHENGKVINGSKYYVNLLVDDVSSEENNEAPEDGEQYVIFEAKYLHSTRSPTGRKRVMCLYTKQQVLERDIFDIAFATDLYEDMPWRMPDALAESLGSWLKVCSWDAFPEFPTARVLNFTMEIIGPYHPGGEESLVGEFDDPTYEAAMHKDLKRVIPICTDQLCPICLDHLVFNPKEAVGTPCSHAFHRDCLVPWLLSRNSCPSCRQPVFQ